MTATSAEAWPASLDEAKEYALEHAFPAGVVERALRDDGFAEVHLHVDTEESNGYILRMHQKNDCATPTQIEELLQTFVARSHWCFLKIRAEVTAMDITFRFRVFSPLF